MQLTQRAFDGGRAAALAQAAPVIQRLVEAVVARELERDDVEGVAYLQETAEVLRRKLSQMPVHLGMGMAIFTLLFDAAAASRGGRPFRALTLAERAAWLARWRSLPLSFFQDFADFYEKMGVFVYYSHVEEAGERP